MKTVETGYKNCDVSQGHASFCEERQEYTVSLLSSHVVCHFNCNFRLMMILQQESAWLIIDFLL